MKNYRTLRIGKGGISLLIGKKALFSFMILLVLTACAVVLSAGIGERFISPGAVAKTFLGMGDPGDDLIIMSFRMPRILVALFAGICLAAAGSILQGLIRNPLASPDIIGVTGGASVAVVLFLMLFSNKNNALTVSISWLPVAAFVGAALAGMLVYFLSYKNGSSTFRLVLIGIGFSMLAQSLTTLFMIKGPIYRMSQANVWITGSVYGSNWQDVNVLLPAALVLLLISAAAARNVNIQTLGEELATGAGRLGSAKPLFAPASEHCFCRNRRCFCRNCRFCRFDGPAYRKKACRIVIRRPLAGCRADRRIARADCRHHRPHAFFSR